MQRAFKELPFLGNIIKANVEKNEKAYKIGEDVCDLLNLSEEDLLMNQTTIDQLEEAGLTSKKQKGLAWEGYFERQEKISASWDAFQKITGLDKPQALLSDGKIHQISKVLTLAKGAMETLLETSGVGDIIVQNAVSNLTLSDDRADGYIDPGEELEKTHLIIRGDDSNELTVVGEWLVNNIVECVNN